jgi:uncharacterized protein YbjT (DUF2867 family)
MKVLLPGIAGFIGKSVAHHLVEAGHEVIGVVRSEKDRSAVASSASVSLYLGDVTRPEDLLKTLPNYDACIYLPGLLREYPAKGVTFQSVHADGVENLITLSKEKGARRWVQMSALGVDQGFNTGYYDTKLQGEQHVRRSGLDWTIFRPSVVFSEEYDPRLNFVSELGNVIAKSPVIPVFGDGKYRLQPVALDVLAKAMADALTMPQTEGKTYDVGGPERLAYREILKIIASAQGMARKPMISIPFGPVKFAASLFDKFAFFPVTQDQLTMLQHENIVDPEAQRMFEETFAPREVQFADGVKRFFAGKP